MWTFSLSLFFSFVTVSGSLTRTSPFIAALLLPLFTGAGFPSEERPLADSLSLLNSTSTCFTAAAPRTPCMPASINYTGKRI